MRITLTTRSGCPPRLDLLGVLPHALLQSPGDQVSRLTLPALGYNRTLGEFFSVSRLASAPSALVLSGDTSQIINAGAGMPGGVLVVDGDAGDLTGCGMQGGTIIITGNAGDCLGVALGGGMIRVAGNVGDWCGAAQPGQVYGMNGGAILVGGNGGSQTGSRMRRGLIALKGDCGEGAAADMIAGTLLSLGRLDLHPGAGMKRGSIIANTAVRLLPAFRPAGAPDPAWLNLLFNHLKRLRFEIPLTWGRREASRYTGDHLALGKGELIIYDIVE